MNMNDKEWNELWDNEPEEDDDYNDVGSDVDANNDETFGNAAEWNEDEHEEMIARDSILSHTPMNNDDWSPFGGKDPFSVLRHEQRVQHEQRLMWQNPKCYTVEELERQIVTARTTNNNSNNNTQQNPKCYTVEELERQIPTRSNDNNHRENQRENQRDHRYNRFNREPRDSREPRDPRDHGDHGDHREQREHHRELRDHREHKEHHREQQQQQHRDHREHHRDQHQQQHQQQHRDMRDRRNNRNKKLTIIPPQVQLSVLDKAKRFHSLTAMHSDEYLQDRMPTTKNGLMFKRHSTVRRDKANHDGVLTERERNWLTKIQEKIQADYDDNLDQDYYYLLYFNRYSMTDEAAQKPCGPGVLDRRFIPRERLLYNSSA